MNPHFTFMLCFLCYGIGLIVGAKLQNEQHMGAWLLSIITCAIAVTFFIGGFLL